MLDGLGPRAPVADGVDVIRDVRIPMRDGIRLAADVYLAAGVADEPMAVVVDYIPYRKDEVDVSVFRHYLTLARHGYAVCRIDIRAPAAPRDGRSTSTCSRSRRTATTRSSGSRHSRGAMGT